MDAPQVIRREILKARPFLRMPRQPVTHPLVLRLGWRWRERLGRGEEVVEVVGLDGGGEVGGVLGDEVAAEARVEAREEVRG